ncbi:ABC transporter ATP-binding protein [Acholeplasma laidlawii]|uniref:ABC transporter ATP-binding protein n=1 Tax=Acholeplasma laidlawii TaxID=2148 RepID=A0A553IHV6_ACHLA|nr:ABC transporter ATP-binding protein [Acholeplasma laidlawii]NWH11422.1 ABC transporter ATP-binding protein [Acholeplasma laidlawii]NWH13168.1 ABC transporter ATP-binding protein [Acholeplasma laidlawii]NWH14976.1 ABC transporter ATP-binding protein [Acholeplasma laidlawii]TRX99783.1 ABC transporter ATP-binding protein [Acholeplasma laidlawii]
MFSVRDLRFTYPKNHVETIKGISFEIKKGEIFGFLGPSGAGKSTTQKILIKLLDRYQGSIYYDSKSLSELNESFYEDIGVSFEMPIHFSKLTAMENIEFFLKLYKNHSDIEDLMKSVGLWEDRNKMVGEFSKGMKIRLNFVRAMLNNPKMLFLDEPTNGLDPANAMILKNLIKAYQKQGGTVFVTSHIMADIDQLCDRVAFIVDGQIKEIDSPRNLKIKYGKRTIKVEYNENNHTASQIFDMDGLNENGTFFKLLKEKKIETIHTGETTLEEIFIKVTGVGLNHA